VAVEKTLDKLIDAVRANMAAGCEGVSAEYARGVIGDVLDGLARVEWEARGEAEVCESEFEELVGKE
jgi:hypothetical protein